MQSNESRQQKNEKRQKPPTKAGTGNPKLSGENRPST
jgi:hypothetical protein